jgi:hypothetical protein
MVANALDINPRCIATRGSAHFGFSLSPRASKIWRKTSNEADLDLAIIDPHMYEIVDRGLRRLDRDIDVRSLGKEERRKYRSRNESRKWHYYRWSDFPSISTDALAKYLEASADWSEKYRSQFKNGISAFFYKDWWCFEDRNRYDMESLCAHPALPSPPESPRTRSLSLGDFNKLLETSPEEVCGAGEDCFTNEAHLSRLSAFTRRLWLSGAFTLADAEAVVAHAPNLEVLDISDAKLHLNVDSCQLVVAELVKLTKLKHVCVNRWSQLEGASKLVGERFAFFDNTLPPDGGRPADFFPEVDSMRASDVPNG